VFSAATGASTYNQRTSNTFTSSVFGDNIENKSRCTKLGGYSQGTEVLFGSAEPDFITSNSNNLIMEPPKKELIIK